MLDVTPCETSPSLSPSPRAEATPALPVFLRQLRVDARGLGSLELAIECGRVRVEVVEDARWIEARLLVLASEEAALEPAAVREALVSTLRREGAAARLTVALRGEEDAGLAIDAMVTVPRSLVVALDHGA